MIHPYRKICNIVFVFVFAVVISIGCCLSALADDSSISQVAFLPFNVQDAGDYAYLQDGVTSMLASRVAARAGIAIASRTEGVAKLGQAWTASQKQLFDQSLKNLQTQLIIAGTMISLDNGIRFDVYLFDLQSGKARKFSAETKSVNGILASVDDLSWDISEQFFGKTRPVVQRKKNIEEESNALRFQTPHPERDFKTGIISSNTDKITSLESVDFTAVTIAGSKKMDMELRGLRVADLNADDVQEIVAVSDKKLIVLHSENETLQIVDTLDLPRNLKVYALYLADINENGISDIYISASVGDVPASFVIEWKGKGQFSYLLAKVPYYIRPLILPNGQSVIAGQKDTIGSDENSTNLLGSPVYHLVPGSKKDVLVEGILDLPDGANIFNFVYADLDNDKMYELVVVDKENKMKVYSHDGSLIWVSEQDYGLSESYLGASFVDQDDTLDREAVYVTSRLLAVDVNGDSRTDIIVGKNKLTTPKFFKNIRSFEGGAAVALTWNGSGMSEMWQTVKVNSYLADYDFIVEGIAGKQEENDSPAGKFYTVTHVEASQLSFLLPFENQSRLQVFKISSKNREKKVQIIKP